MSQVPNNAAFATHGLLPIKMTRTSQQTTLDNKRYILAKQVPSIQDLQQNLVEYITQTTEKVICENLGHNEMIVVTEIVEIEHLKIITNLSRSSASGLIKDRPTLKAIGFGTVLFAGPQSKFQVGSKVIGNMGLQSISKIDDSQVQLLVQIPKLSWSCSLALLMESNGLLAYIGLNYVLKRPLVGETVVVTMANSQVGIIACQLAKYYGCNVIGICESETALQVTSLGINAVITNGNESVQEQIEKTCPHGIDFVFHCGGKHLDSIFFNLNEHSRTVLCSDVIDSLVFTTQLIAFSPKSGSITAFKVKDYESKYQIAKAKLIYHYFMRDIQCLENTHYGIDSVRKAIQESVDGKYAGKIMVNLK